MVQYTRYLCPARSGITCFMSGNNPLDPNHMMARGSYEPGKHPGRDPKDKYVLIFTVAGIVICCTIGVIIGTAIGGFSGTFIGIVAGLLIGGFGGVFLGDFVKQKTLKKHDTYKGDEEAENNRGPFID